MMDGLFIVISSTLKLLYYTVVVKPLPLVINNRSKRKADLIGMSLGNFTRKQKLYTPPREQNRCTPSK